MDIPVLIAAVILTVIAVTEVICLLCCPKVKAVPLTVIVRGDDPRLEEKLRYTAYLFATEECCVTKIMIIECGEDYHAKAVCARFCAEFPERANIVNEKNENFVQKIIDFTAEI